MSSECPLMFTVEGFNDLKNARNLLRRHKEGSSQRQTLISLLLRKNKDERVDSQLVKQMNIQENYCHKLLERIIEVVKLLAERGPSFRDSDE